jgi:hypothetical protein
VPGTVNRRLLTLERNGEIEHAAAMKELQYEIFDAMHFNRNDDRLLDTIAERGEASTPEEQAAFNELAIALKGRPRRLF